MDHSYVRGLDYIFIIRSGKLGRILIAADASCLVSTPSTTVPYAIPASGLSEEVHSFKSWAIM